MKTPLLNARWSLRNILFTTDFSSASEAALPYVLAFARWYCSKIIVAHIVAPEARRAISLEPIPVAMDQAWQDAKRKMEQFVQNQPLTDVPHEVVVERGEMTSVLSTLVSGRDIDLLILGSHGREGIKKMVLGSKAEQIFRTATCPVLTVGPKATRQSIDFRMLKRILFATDFSAASLHALPYALSLAEEKQADLTLLHLIPLVPLDRPPGDVEDSLRKRLRALVPPEARPWCSPEFLVHFEFPPEGILQAAQERVADLIVIGVHHVRHPRTAAHTPWEIAYDVVCRAHCPVLTVRA